MRLRTLLRVCLSIIAVASTLTTPDAFAQPSQGNPQTGGMIDSILVLGNKKTKEFVILDEMTLTPGKVYTEEAARFDRERIYSLGLFTRVDLEYQRIDSTGFLIVDVNERWYLIPFPIFGFRDGDPKRPYYGAGLLHNNFRGVNQKIYGAFALGSDPSANLQFSDPLIDREDRLSFAIGLSTSKIRNKSVEQAALTGDFDERHYDAHVQLGKRFDLYTAASVWLGYGAVQVSEYQPGRTASPTGKDNTIYASLDYTYDSRDLREYASRGSFVGLIVTKYGFGESDLDYTRFGSDFRTYAPLPLDLTFAARAYASVVAGGMLPTYAHQYMGYNEKLRGYYGTVLEGEDIAGATLELRYPLLRAITINVSSLPIPQEFSIWRFGIIAALFADAGTTWHRGDELKLGSFYSGYGAGFHFLLPYGYIARVEAAVNEYGKSQIIFDLRGSI
jgi:outer membrane protein assembly factor BamA